VELDNTREGTQRKTTTNLERRDTEDFERKRNWMERSKSYTWRSWQI